MWMRLQERFHLSVMFLLYLFRFVEYNWMEWKGIITYFALQLGSARKFYRLLDIFSSSNHQTIYYYHQDVVNGTNGKKEPIEIKYRGKEKLRLDRKNLDVIHVEL